jgi:hypothetical protein
MDRAFPIFTSPAAIQASQELDDHCRRITEQLRAPFTIRNAILFREGNNGLQLVVPQALRQAALELAHSHLTAGHLSVRITLSRLKKLLTRFTLRDKQSTILIHGRPVNF